MKESLVIELPWLSLTSRLSRVSLKYVIHVGLSLQEAINPCTTVEAPRTLVPACLGTGGCPFVNGQLARSKCKRCLIPSWS